MIIKEFYESNLFNIEKENKTKLVFITEKAHISGKIMKGIEFRQPSIIETLKETIKTSNKIGDVIIIKNYAFVILRKHYNSRVSANEFEKVLKIAQPKLEGLLLKTTNEDWPDFQELIFKFFPNVEFRKSSEWPHK